MCVNQSWPHVRESEAATGRWLHMHKRCDGACVKDPTAAKSHRYLWVSSVDNGYLQCETHMDTDWGLRRWVPIEQIPIPMDNTR